MLNQGVSAAVMGLLLASPALAQQASRRASLRNTGPIRVVVENLNQYAQRGGLTTDELRTEVELQLEDQEIAVDDSGSAWLYTAVNVIPTADGRYAFCVTVQLMQPSVVASNGLQMTATTWDASYLEIGAASDLGINVRYAVREQVEQFIADYLGVNTREPPDVR